MWDHAKDALCVVMGSKAHTMTPMAASIGSAILYGVTSTSMAFLNKAVLDVYTYNYPLMIMTQQMLVTFMILKVLDLLKFIKLQPLTRTNLTEFIPACFFYSLNGVLSLAALGEMNLTMYSVLKRNGPLVTMILTSVFIKHAFPSRMIAFSISMMSIGCIVAANGDMAFDWEAYLFGIGSLMSQSLYLIFLQRLSDTYSTTDELYMNSVLSFPVLAICCILFGETGRAFSYTRYHDVGFIFFLLLLLVMGSFLNFTLFLCNSNNSALTTSVVGTLKSVAQTTMGMFTFGGVSINVAMVTGVTMNMTGGVLYTYAKYQESEKKKEMKKNESLGDIEQGNHQKSDAQPHENGIHPREHNKSDVRNS